MLPAPPLTAGGGESLAKPKLPCRLRATFEEAIAAAAAAASSSSPSSSPLYTSLSSLRMAIYTNINTHDRDLFSCCC